MLAYHVVVLFAAVGSRDVFDVGDSVAPTHRALLFAPAFVLRNGDF